MGLPFWPDEPATDRPDGWAGTLAPEAAAASLEVLASPVRLAVLDALRREGPLSYTALRTAAGVEDKGRFNYHVRQLDGLLEADDGTYRLTDRGERAVRGVLAADVAQGE